MSDPRPEKAVDPVAIAHTPETAPHGPSRGSRFAAESFGTFLLVFGLIGTVLFGSYFAHEGAASAPGIVYLAASGAVGIAVIVGVYAFGPISGGHFNPAVTLGLVAAGRFPLRDAWFYISAQVVGAISATTVIVLLGVFGPDGWLAAAQDSGFASNGWGSLSPGGFAMPAAIIVEVVLTALFLFVILGATHPTRGTKLACLVIGLTLTVIHLVSIPIDNTSVNPARSVATALYGGGDALVQVWAFVVFPILGAVVAGLIYRTLFDGTDGD